MGRGNVCVTGDYEGLYYIDRDHTDVYRRSDPMSDDDPETRLMGDLDHAEITGPDWVWDEWGSAEELDDVLECFKDSFTRMFPSFERVSPQKWIDRSTMAILENKLFYIGIEDNEWSEAVKLLQKEDPYSDSLSGLQKQHYQRYLDGMKKALLERLPSIGCYTGAWTSGTIKREDIA